MFDSKYVVAAAVPVGVFALLLFVCFWRRRRSRCEKEPGESHPTTLDRLHQADLEEALIVSNLSVEENTSFLFDDDANSSSNCTFILGQSESSSSHVAVDGSGVQFSSDDRKNSICSIKLSTGAVKVLINDGIIDAITGNEEPHDSSFGKTISKGDAEAVLKSMSLETRLSKGRFTDLGCNELETPEKTMEYECSGYESNETHAGLIDSNFSPYVMSTDMCCGFNESRSNEKPIDDKELIRQSPGCFGIRSSSSNSVSDYNVNNSTTSHEHLEPSDDKEHTGSCTSTLKRPVINEVCTADSQLTCTDRPENDCTDNLRDELHGSILPNEDCVCTDDDEALPKIDSSRIVQCHKNAVAELSMHTGYGVTSKDGLESQNDPAVKWRKKKFSANEESQIQEMLKKNYANSGKYWNQRYLLFSKYDERIIMDKEGWYSVTPESIARHHASRCGGGSIIDGFTGVGGNAIQFAQMSKRVTAIDIDPQKILCARQNAAVYGVEDQINFVTDDFFVLAPSLKADAIFLSPPWGGPGYAKRKTYDIKTMLKPRDGYSLFNAAKKIAPMIVMFLPRNVNQDQLDELSLSSPTPWSLEVEENCLYGELKAITAYFISDGKKRPTKFTSVNLP